MRVEIDLRDTPHNFEKINSATLVAKDGTMYDKYKCTRCGVKGHGYGVSEIISVSGPSNIVEKCKPIKRDPKLITSDEIVDHFKTEEIEIKKVKEYVPPTMEHTQMTLTIEPEPEPEPEPGNNLNKGLVQEETEPIEFKIIEGKLPQNIKLGASVQRS